MGLNFIRYFIIEDIIVTNVFKFNNLLADVTEKCFRQPFLFSILYFTYHYSIIDSFKYIYIIVLVGEIG